MAVTSFFFSLSCPCFPDPSDGVESSGLVPHRKVLYPWPAPFSSLGDQGAGRCQTRTASWQHRNDSFSGNVSAILAGRGASISVPADGLGGLPRQGDLASSATEGRSTPPLGTLCSLGAHQLQLRENHRRTHTVGRTVPYLRRPRHDVKATLLTPSPNPDSFAEM
ncbi:hypothetical protein VTI74DRAFT_9227 [Chaetomium olivicolor]